MSGISSTLPRYSSDCRGGLPARRSLRDDLGGELAAVDLLVEHHHRPLRPSLAQQVNQGLGLKQVTRHDPHEVAAAAGPQALRQRAWAARRGGGERGQTVLGRHLQQAGVVEGGHRDRGRTVAELAQIGDGSRVVGRPVGVGVHELRIPGELVALGRAHIPQADTQVPRPAAGVLERHSRAGLDRPRRGRGNAVAWQAEVDGRPVALDRGWIVACVVAQTAAEAEPGRGHRAE